MENLNFKKIKGYIEGYYGKLLTWKERIKILKSLNKNKMNFYFYCPKEDIFHRLKWRSDYSRNWIKSFKKFCKIAKQYNINIIVGISPGIDFDFKSFVNGNYSDFKILKRKLNSFIEYGADYTSILFDDIPNNFYQKFGLKNEGVIHANLMNDISNDFKLNLFTVPRIYSDEMVKEAPTYLDDFISTINKSTYTFFCGKNIVSNNFESNIKIIKNKIKNGKIINWVNFYANDYCPKRLIIGPWENNNLINKSMINGTGNINTDELILEIVHKTVKKLNKIHVWKKILRKNKIPDEFFNISKFFLSPNFSFENEVNQFEHSEETYEVLDFLLWRWKTKISREWYPYLLNFKHDLQILDKSLSFNRILKTQTYPIQHVLKHRRD